MRRALALTALFAAAVIPAGAADTFKLDGKAAKITFVGTKTDGKHTGGFKKVDGTATVDGDDLTTLKIDLTIETDSVYSDNEGLTAHLKRSDFFSVKEFPKATFKLTKVEKTKDGYTQTGDLTMLGKTKAVSLPSKIKMDGGQLVITSDFKIKRSDWGMTYGKGKIDDEVKMKVEVKAKK